MSLSTKETWLLALAVTHAKEHSPQLMWREAAQKISRTLPFPISVEDADKAADIAREYNNTGDWIC